MPACLPCHSLAPSVIGALSSLETIANVYVYVTRLPGLRAPANVLGAETVMTKAATTPLAHPVAVEMDTVTRD